MLRPLVVDIESKYDRFPRRDVSSDPGAPCVSGSCQVHCSQWQLHEAPSATNSPRRAPNPRLTKSLDLEIFTKLRGRAPRAGRSSAWGRRYPSSICRRASISSNARRHSWGGGAYTASAAHWRCRSRHPLVLSCLLVPAIADPVCKCNANIKLPSALQNSDQVQCNTSWSQNGYGGCSVLCVLCSVLQ